MVSSLHPGISLEARVALCTSTLTRQGLREIVALLPEDDAHLLGWIEEAIERVQTDEFLKLLYAAAIAGRTLPASLVAGNRLELFNDGWRFGWIAAHLEGDVTAALLTTSGDAVSATVVAFAMYVAARWWLKHRPGEPFPSKLQASARNFRKHLGITPEVTAVVGAMAVMMKDVALARMWGGEGRSADLDREGNLKRIEAFFEKPLEASLPEREDTGYHGHQPMRRAVEKVGRNVRCRCGSGEKYKDCCIKADQERLRRSSAVAGKTWDELEGDIEAVTEVDVIQMTLPELARISVVDLVDKVQLIALQRLAQGGHFDPVVDTFRELGVPKRLVGAWLVVIQLATRAWQREVVMKLIEAGGDEAIPLAQMECSVRLLVASQDPAEFCATVEAESLALLKSHDSQGLQDLAAGLTWSPYRALGIMVARGALLLTEPEHSSWIFDQILSTRGDLDLPIDDPSADLLDERASRRRAGDDYALLDEAQAKLEAKAAEVREVREKLAAVEREIGLREKREKRAAAAPVTAPAADPTELGAMREKVETLKSLLKERGEERVNLRREMEKLQADMAALKAAQEASGSTQEESEELPGEALAVQGHQPVRGIELPKKFQERLASFPPQVGRAVMPLLGRLAGGEPGAFKGLDKILECDDVVRARVAGDYRLLLRFTPSAVEVFDVVNRRDLQRRAKQLRAKGF